MAAIAQTLPDNDTITKRADNTLSEKKTVMDGSCDGVNDTGKCISQLPSPLPSPLEQFKPHVNSSATRPTFIQLDSAGVTNWPTNDKGLLAGSVTAPPKLAEKSSNGVRRLSATKIAELAESLPIAVLPSVYTGDDGQRSERSRPLTDSRDNGNAASTRPVDGDDPMLGWSDGHYHVQKHWNSTGSLRTLSTPPMSRRKSSAAQSISGQPATVQPVASNASTRRHSHNAAVHQVPLQIDTSTARVGSALHPPPQLPQKTDPTPPLSHTEAHQHLHHHHGQPQHIPRIPSPIPPSIPLPPMSLPTLLQLELAGQRPSPLYIHRSQTANIPYESNAVKFERLKNFLLLPTYLERTMNFGALACLDAWLWTLTILPIRFCIALSVLVRWWAYMLWKEVRWMIAFVWRGLGRMWKRGRRPSRAGETMLAEAASKGPRTAKATAANLAPAAINGRPRGRSNGSSTSEGVASSSSTAGSAPSRSQPIWGHRRTKSMPSNLTSFHKADLLQGAVIIFSSVALMNLDASRMYHFIRAQSAVKLYVIYNLVEVGDRLLSALGQDVFECLFSSETLSRTAAGRSKILLPFGMFCLSLVYNVAHTVVLFYQVITLNVAVNSYSNALLSLLMSNQFVEVKSSVFKRTEKENTFQLACADIVERFQLWIVLFIIALRNVVEIGGLSVPGAGIDFDGSGSGDEMLTKVPLHNTSILPASFTILPSWLVSVEVLSPFLIVIGSEMVVDWIKHGYINKFNNIKPTFYSRILDILCKDYYTNAFLAPALMRRLGLPLIPLCTLFIRSSVQTYHMFLATHLPSPVPPTTHTSLVAGTATPSSPAMAASLERLDLLIRNALGRSVHGNPYSIPADAAPAAGAAAKPSWWLSSDDLIAGVTMVVVFFIMFLILLIAKLLLGMALLRYSRNRYAAMKLQEHAETLGTAEPESFDATGKRTGGYGKIEVGEERRRWIFHDDPEGLKKQRDKERRETSSGKGGGGKKETDLTSIVRYEMVAKRIW